ncbi:MAG: type II toxin-antitoxin system RelE/ParE family toxin [Planctomycetes bacterium]|nr:type II toxin-antitoxin system RelE/ParE family toxin [Planctomycetota bacterium]
MIRSFGDAATGDLYHGHPSARSRGFPADIRAAAIRKLDMVHAAHALADLRMPPGNRLEALRGDLRGFHSIRVNDQWRIVFRWSEQVAHDVRVTDYHR